MMIASAALREPMMTDVTTRDRVLTIARWLAHQRAVPLGQAEATAWRIIEAARGGAFALEGPRAPLVVQARVSLWLIGQLGGRALIRVFTDQEAAVEKARELGQELEVKVLVIGQGGELADHIEPVAPQRILRAVPDAVEVEPVALRVARHEDRWAVFVADRVVATAPTRERARQRARVLKADPDFVADPTRPVPSG